MTVGLLHPGEMGAALGGALHERGETVLWASAGRGPATAERAERARLEDAGEIAELCRSCEILLSVCPPHAALDVAREAAGFTGLYVDANAVSSSSSAGMRSVRSPITDARRSRASRLIACHECKLPHPSLSVWSDASIQAIRSSSDMPGQVCRASRKACRLACGAVSDR